MTPSLTKPPRVDWGVLAGAASPSAVEVSGSGLPVPGQCSRGPVSRVVVHAVHGVTWSHTPWTLQMCVRGTSGRPLQRLSDWGADARVRGAAGRAAPRPPVGVSGRPKASRPLFSRGLLLRPGTGQFRVGLPARRPDPDSVKAVMPALTGETRVPGAQAGGGCVQPHPADGSVWGGWMRDEEDSAWNESRPPGSLGELSPEPPSPRLVALHARASGLPRGAQVPMGPHSHGSRLSPAPRLPTGLPVGPTGRPGPGDSCGDRFSLGICRCLGGVRAEPAEAEDAGPPQGAEATDTRDLRAHHGRPRPWRLQKTSQPEPSLARGARS